MKIFLKLRPTQIRVFGMKRIAKIIVSISSLILLSSCDRSDEEFSIKRKDYLGNEIKTNGYFYSYDSTSSTTSIKFLYRNGVVLSGGRYSLHDLDIIESEILSGTFIDNDNKYNWSPFEVNNKTLIIETYYSNPPSSKLLTMRSFYDIQNDTTIVLKRVDHPGYKNEVYNTFWHFKQFSPKPDSTNIYIK